MEQARSARMWAAVSACARRDGAPVSLRHVVVACSGALAALTADELAQGLMFADLALVLILDERGGITASANGWAEAVVGGRGGPPRFPGPDGAAADAMRDDGNDSPEPGAQPGGRGGEET